MAFLLNLGSFFTGVVFGITLLLSSLSDSNVMRSQFSNPMNNSQTIQTFLSASVISAIIVYAANWSSYTKIAYRSNTSYGWLGPFDANVVGGALQGIGMALSGADPGTALVQMASGITSARWVVSGGILGALIFVLFGSKFKYSNSSPHNNAKPPLAAAAAAAAAAASASAAAASASEITSTHTIQQYLKISAESAIFLYAISTLVVLIASQCHATGFHSHSPVNSIADLNPIVGGAMIGSVQGLSILLTKKTLGISSAYQDVASHIVTFLKCSTTRKSSSTVLIAGHPGCTNIIFAAGIMCGAKLAHPYFYNALSPPSSPLAAMLPVIPSAALIGGFTTIFGARLAGGCTSGHGLSGTSTLSISSFVTMASLFSAGIIFRQIARLS